MKKSLANIGGELSRIQMKSITAGKPLPSGDGNSCSDCHCSGGAVALPAEDGPGGAECYCPDGSGISGPGGFHCN